MTRSKKATKPANGNQSEIKGKLKFHIVNSTLELIVEPLRGSILKVLHLLVC